MSLFSNRFTRLSVLSIFGACFYASASVANSFPDVTLSSLHDEFSEPWALTQLPSGEWLVTEKSGSVVKLTESGEKQFYTDMPDNLYVAGQGGLMDIDLHPQFDKSPWIYISYAEGDAAANRLAIARAEYRKGQLGPWQTIFRATPDKNTPVHYAARLAFDAQGALLITSGDGFDFREQAQVADSMLGKVLRMSDDGKPLADNPLYTGEGKARDYVYTMGHRNAQGLVVDPLNGDVWLNEHGPAGGDEINQLYAGANYGWPVVTYGKDYSGANISPFERYPGMEMPLVDWTPSIAPSSMALYRGSLFEALQGDFLVTALKTKRLHWVRLKGDKVEINQPVVENLNHRLRDIHVGVDGAVYILTNGDRASLLKMVPR